MKRKNKLLSLLLAAVMVLSLLPGMTVTASAEDGATTLYVNGVDMLSESSTAPSGVSYDKSTNTLTLTNAALNQFYIGNPKYDWKYAAVIYAVGVNLTIKLIGDNRITYNDASEKIQCTCGIYFNNVNLTITGDGTLAIQNTATQSKANFYRDICGEENSSLTIDGTTVQCVADSTAETLNAGVYGISLSKGALTVRNGQLTVSTRNATSEAYGIALYDTNAMHTLNGNSQITAVAGINDASWSSDYSYGIFYLSTIQLGAGAKLYASGAGTAIYENESSITAADGAMLSAKGNQEHKASSGLTEISISDNTIKANAVKNYKTLEVTASASTPSAPTFTDGFGNSIENASTYVKGTTTNDKGYTFAGWFDGDTELEKAEAAVAGKTYTAKWTKNGKTVRTTALDLRTTDTSQSNSEEGWSWDATTKTLTFSGVTIDIPESNTSAIVAVCLPDGATVKTDASTKNTICNSSEAVEGAIGLMGMGALTIDGSGELSITGKVGGIFSNGALTINAPLAATITGEKGMAVSARTTITLGSSVSIKTPTGGKVCTDKGAFIGDSNGTHAKEVVIGVAAAAPTFTDGLGKADCTFNTYTKGTKNDKGYTFAGWFDGDTELKKAEAAVDGKTYTAKWTKNGKTVRTAVLDLTEISESNTLGATYNNGVYANEAEGWTWNTTTTTLTLSGATFDVNKQSTEPNIEGSGAILLPANASVTTKKGTENTVHNGSTIVTALGTYIGSGIVSEGAFTIKGDGELSVTAGAFGVFALGDVSIEAPISIVCTETKGNVAAVVTNKDHSITIAPSLCIKTPTKGKVASSDVGRYIAERDGQTLARTVVIGAASNSYYYYGGGSYNGTQSTVTSDLTTVTRVTVDGKTVSPKNYTVSGGNITFTDAFLGTLSNGLHKVTIENDKYIARGTFNVNNPAGTGAAVSPKTADAGISLYAGMAVASLLGSGVVFSRKRKDF